MSGVSLEQSLGKVLDDADEMPNDPRLIMEVLSKEPIFEKYMMPPKDEKSPDNKPVPKDTIQTMKKMLASPVFGGSVFSKRIEGHRNILKRQIANEFRCITSTGASYDTQELLNAGRSAGERYYILHNVQVQRGYPWFVDIWILIKQVFNRE